MDAFWAAYVDRPDQLADPLVAPLRADLTGLPPAFLAIAECDILADCNDAFARKLEEAGVPARAVTYKGATPRFLEAVSIAPLPHRAANEQPAWARAIATECQPAIMRSIHHTLALAHSTKTPPR